MAVYSEPIKWAIIIFPFLAFFISGALLIYEYRKYGSFVWTRAMILYSFVFYLLCAYTQDQQWNYGLFILFQGF